MSTPHALSSEQALTRLHELTVLDVRTPGEYATGHLPGALNIPLDQISRALPAIHHAADRGDILVVCASEPAPTAHARRSRSTASTPPPSPGAPAPGPPRAMTSTAPSKARALRGAWNARSA